MEPLQNIIKNESLEKIEKLLFSNGFFEDSKYFDYKALIFAIQFKRQDVIKFLLSKNCRVNSDLNKSQETPLHHAVRLADANLIDMLLLNNASITATNSKGNTPLHLAFLTRYDKIVELMLSYINMQDDCDFVNVRNEQGLTHMHIACANDDAELVERFIKAGVYCREIVSKESPYCAGFTALHFAITHHCTDVARILLRDENLDLQTENSNGLTSFQLSYTTAKSSQIIFHFALEQSEYQSFDNHLTQFHMACLTNFSDLVKTYIENGAAVDSPVRKAANFCPLYTPLHFAVESQCTENVELLLQAGVDVNKKNADGMTPLHLALYCENREEENAIVDMLYQATISKEDSHVDVNQLSYLHIAVTRNDGDLVKKFLDERKEDVNLSVLRNSRNFSGYTSLHFAVRYEHLEMTRLLISRGARINDNWSEHGTPLHLAFEAGRKDLVDLLLDNGAQVNFKRIKDGMTMLHLLVEYYLNDFASHEDVEDCKRWDSKGSLLRYFGKLLDLGCDVNAKETIRGQTALHLACSKIWYGADCAKLLLELGANINAENKLGMTPLECALSDDYEDYGVDCMALYHHVQELKAANLQVNPKNDEACEKIKEMRVIWEQFTVTSNGVNIFSYQELERRHDERLDEITKMQNVKLDARVTLCEFVSMKPKYAASYANNKILIELLQDNNVKRKYPVYAYLIRLCYWRAFQRFNTKGIVKKRTKRRGQRKRGCIVCSEHI